MRWMLESACVATTDLKLDEPGSLPRPGPIGRVARLLLGIACLAYVQGLIQVAANLLDSDGHIRTIIWNGMVPGLFLVSYIINIGYSRPWKKWPAIFSAGLFLVIGTAGFLSVGTPETNALALTIWSWEMYLASHLGIAFIISALIATPGCEMRAFHDLYSRRSGVPVKEHYCPVGPLNSIDQWESGRSEH